MKLPSEQQVVRQAVDMLAALAEIPADRADVEVGREPSREGQAVDALAHVGPYTFAIEVKSSGAAAPVSAAIEQLRRYADAAGPDVIPLLVVPFMGEVGRKRCEEAGVAWLDLSSNAHIVAPGLRILIEGKPNRFKRRGRPSTAFAPKSSRITRWLLMLSWRPVSLEAPGYEPTAVDTWELMHSRLPVTQRELARLAGLDEGYTSRIVAKLEGDGLIMRDSDGAIRPRDPDTLLEAWREDYEFAKHEIIRGHVPARSGDELLRRLGDGLREQGVDHAATGLGAAWLLTRFAGFRLATVYLREPPEPSVLEALSFREEERGANVWLVVPNDEGVFHQAASHRGVRCVHPVQVYVDLEGQPERAQEAAERLRAELLTWKDDA